MRIYSIFSFICLSLVLWSSPALAQSLLNDDSNCGALGYACVGGRTCSSGRCSPAWVDISETNAPDPRAYSSATTFGGKLLVTGGCTTTDFFSIPETDGGVYDPSNDTWSSAPSLNNPRAQHNMIATSSAAYAYGGIQHCYDGTTVSSNLESLTSLSGSWSSLSPTNPIGGRYDTSMSLVSGNIFVYGGSNSGAPTLSDGGIYNPSTNSWSTFTCGLSNCDRGQQYVGFLNGSSVQFFGGNYSTPTTGVQYSTLTSSFSTFTVPASTPDFFSVFADRPRVGGDSGRRVFLLGTDGVVHIYDRLTNVWTTDSATWSSGVCAEGAAASWIGSELIVWSGLCGGDLVNGGARYQPPAACHLNLLGFCVL